MATTRTWTGWLATLLLIGAAVVPVTPAVADEPEAVIVWGGSSDAAATAVDEVGGEVTTTLPLIGAVAADLEPAAVQALEGSTDLQVVTDRSLEFQSIDEGSTPISSPRPQITGSNPPDHWSMGTGAGVGVALIDTGVAEHDDLEGRVFRHDLTEDGGDGIDEYGHGTFMAGLIAGDGGSSSDGPTGLAPGAHVVSVKVADEAGETSLSRVLEAIGWVVINQVDHNIRVLNLSIGVPTPVSPQADPLVAAVQTAWASGITVVTAAGNEGGSSTEDDGQGNGNGRGNGDARSSGHGQGPVTSPGRDPYAITVGALDSEAASDGRYEVPAWSGQGRVTSTDKPELLAPGTSAISLRVPGSTVDDDHADARVGGDDGDYFRGSGTSMSTALASGAAAALLELRDHATPDDVKGALVSSGRPVAGAQGNALDLAAADTAEPDDDWRQQHPTSFVAPPGEPHNHMPWAADDAPSVEETWQRVRWMDGDWQRVRWMDGEWQRVRWMDDGEWQRVRWMEDSFQRVRWMDATLQRVRWMDDHFARVRWMDDGAWARVRWMDDGAWARVRWMDDDWQRVRWMDDAWPDRAWTAADWGTTTPSDPPAP